MQQVTKRKYFSENGRPKNFTISLLFDYIHTGEIFNSIIFKILFGFMSVAVVFLCLILIIKNSYRNTVKSTKAHFTKYHRLLFLYTLPLVFVFGPTGALFNLGVYSTPLITNYAINRETINVLKVDNNILVDKPLDAAEQSVKMENIKLTELSKICQG